jgi:hypothetical protein
VKKRKKLKKQKKEINKKAQGWGGPYHLPRPSGYDWNIGSGESGAGIIISGPNNLRIIVPGPNLSATIGDIYDKDLQTAIRNSGGRRLSIEEIKRIFFMGLVARISGRLAGNLANLMQLAPLINILNDKSVSPAIMTGLTGAAQNILNQMFKTY